MIFFLLRHIFRRKHDIDMVSFFKETMWKVLQPCKISSKKHHAIRRYRTEPGHTSAHFWVPPYFNWLQIFFRDTPWLVDNFYIKTFRKKHSVFTQFNKVWKKEIFMLHHIFKRKHDIDMISFSEETMWKVL